MVTFLCLLNKIKLVETYAKMTFMFKMMTIVVKYVSHWVQSIPPKRLNKVSNYQIHLDLIKLLLNVDKYEYIMDLQD